MDMQNVSNLQIPEGTVRTIHNKDNRLIWGRVNYDTKYIGDTLQNGTPTPDAPIPVQTVTGEQTVKVTGKNLFSSAMELGSLNNQGAPAPSTYAIRTVDYIPVLPDTTYTVSNNNNYYNYVYQYDDGKNIISFNAERPSYTFTSKSNTRFIKLRTNAGTVENDLSTKFQLELGSTATTYESYQSQSYLVDVGSIELCKIGDYQDYIYNSGNDWYVHNECGEQAVDTSAITLRSSYSNIDYAVITKPSNSVFYGNYQEMQYPLLYTHAEHSSPGGNFNNASYVGKIFMSGQANNYWVGFTKNTSLDSIKSVLNGATLYYPLTIATDTQIADATLIEQLNAVHEWLTRYGYNATVSGNLPLIVDRTNL